jgi:hypothetical protein
MKSKSSIHIYNFDNHTHVVYEEITTIRPSQHRVCIEAVMVICKGINRDAEDVADYISQIYDHLWCSTGEATFSAAAISLSSISSSS